MEKIQLLILDIDGIMTDGTLHYTADGEQVKCFHAHDGYGIKMLTESGVNVAIISGKNGTALQRRLNDLGIIHRFLGVVDKLQAYQTLMTRLGLKDQQVAYMGDDLPDLPVMQKVALPMTVPDAVPEIIQCATYCSNKKGGRGAVREACDYLIAQNEAL